MELPKPVHVMVTAVNGFRRRSRLPRGSMPALDLGAARPRLSRRTLIVIALVAVAGGWVVQQPGANQSAHYVSIQSLTSGRHNVDRLARDASDLAWTDGHYHAAKSPGLDMVLAPVTLALRGAGVTFDNAPPE